MSVASFDQLAHHVGHRVAVVTYGSPPVNAAIECETCSEVLLDFDADAPPACDWLVRVRSGNPEPDFPEDLWMEVPCGLPRVPHPQYPEGTTCDAGHDRLPIEIAWAPFGPEWQREQQERYDETGSWF